MITLGDITLDLSFFVFSWIFFTVTIVMVKHIVDSKSKCTKLKWFNMVSVWVAALLGMLYDLVPTLADNNIYRIVASLIGTVAVVLSVISFVISCKAAYDAEFNNSSI